jgi:dimethylamine/trimethylamine dehydrogenase
MTLGVALHLSHAPMAFGPGGARIACTYTGQARDVAADAVLLVTSRSAADSLGPDLAARRADWAVAGIRSVTVIGDADAPAPIAWAVYAGRRYGEDLDGLAIGDALPFRREIAQLTG